MNSILRKVARLRPRSLDPELHRERSSVVIGSYAVCLLAASALIGWGDASNFGFYSPFSLVLVTAGTALLGVVMLRRSPKPRDYRWLTDLALVIVVASYLTFSVVYPVALYHHATLFLCSRLLTASAGVVTLVSLLLRFRRPVWTLRVVAILASAAGCTAIRAYPRPAIDVWYMFQAAAHALAHGHNIYTAHWSSGISWEVSNKYTYLPGSAVLLTPFYAVFGDVRYGMLAALVVTALLVGKMGSRSIAPYAGCLILIFPKFSLLIEQSWNDPLILLAVACAVVAVQKDRRGWAVTALASGLVLKAYALLIIPLAVFWRPIGIKRASRALVGASVFLLPWILVNPRAFWDGSVVTPLRGAARGDALSLISLLLRHGRDPGIFFTAAFVGLALGLVMLRNSGTSWEFLLGLGLVMAVFNLTSKEPYFNEWMLTVGYCIVAFAASQSADSSAPPSQSEEPRLPRYFDVLRR